jgi:acetyl esterase/lipase
VAPDPSLLPDDPHVPDLPERPVPGARSLPLRIAASALRRPRRVAYGPDRAQVADLHVPRGPGPFPVVVLLHGGHWQARYGRLVCRPLARDLAARGVAAWNLEYRRLGVRGGWPQTFEDVARGTDALADLADPRLDKARVAYAGHSAGGQLALWAASRTRLTAGAVGADPRVVPVAVAALAPVTTLRRAGQQAVELLGGRPEAVPERWAQADPLALAPPPVPVLVVHPEGDRTVPVERSREYAARPGAAVALVTPPGEGHRDPIDPSSASWAVAAGWLAARLRAGRPVSGGAAPAAPPA